ncbi:hypothetical protein CC79DRAFT_726933 [Sarocladium strictum]
MIVRLVDVHRGITFWPGHERSARSISRIVGEDGGKLYLGRYPNSRDTDIGSPYVSFESGVVSQDHAEIELDPDGMWWLKDVGSSSGTYINHVRLSRPDEIVERHALEDGDIIQLGGNGHENKNRRNTQGVERMKFRVHTTESTFGTASHFPNSTSSSPSSSSNAGRDVSEFLNRTPLTHSNLRRVGSKHR